MPEEEAAKKTALALLPFAAVALVLIVILYVAGILLQGGTQEQKCSNAILPEWKDSCFSALARELNDSAFCARIARTGAKDACLAQTGADCSQFSSQVMRDNCYLMRVNDSGSCAQVSSNVSRDQCYYDAATNNGNATLCAGIGEEMMRFSCSNGVNGKLALESGNVSFCNAIEYGNETMTSAMVDGCISSVAQNRSDSSLCAGITNQTARQACEAMSGTSEIDCSLLTDVAERQVCEYGQALVTNSTEDCLRISGGSLRDNCMLQKAVRLGNESICELIVNQGVREACERNFGTG